MSSMHRIAVVLFALLASAAAFPAPQDARRDPTQQDPRIRDALGGQRSEGTVAVPTARVSMPSMSLRALVVASGKEGAAIVQCGEALYSIHAGGVFRAAATPSTSLDVRVVSLSADEVRLESVSTGEVLILR